MRTVNIEGSAWLDTEAFFRDLAKALGAFAGHGMNHNAFIDTMVYHHELLTVQPPYVVVVSTPNPKVEVEVKNLSQYLIEAREWRKANWGDDADVRIEIA